MISKFLITASICLSLFIVGCSSNNEKTPAPGTEATTAPSASADSVNKGIGKFKSIALTHPLDKKMVEAGEAIYNSKCIACHKLTNEKLVGPGWKGVTTKRSPEWIMNFEVNTNVMLDSDLVAQQLLVTCVARMPSQNLSDDDARNVLEFMRHNDGEK